MRRPSLNQATKPRRAASALVATIVCLAAAGCGVEDAKSSHFEHDHVVAPHWPEDVHDLSIKLRVRLDALSWKWNDPEALRREMIDLIGWAPEIAADTNMTEADWNVIDRAAETLLEDVRGSEQRLTTDHRDAIAKFQKLVDDLRKTIPETLDSFAAIAP